MRTRFAPSPTGALHLGNVRIAVFNWLLARHHGGSFLLRLEDTDVERNRPGAEADILRDLRWLGLEWDEGPDVGGPVGPYRQSEAESQHREAAERLLSAGSAFRCYCVEEERPDGELGTDGAGARVHAADPCRALDPDARRRLESEGRRPAIRFRVDEEHVRVEDAVRGPVSFPGADLGDFVILRRDGRPTYNFAVVVDDARMRVSHVVRGAGHLSNTPKQALLFDALGVSRPTFAHLPTVLAPGGGKLSKREGAAAVAELRREGYHPEGVVNYVSLLGWSAPSEEEVLPVEELVAHMDLARVGASDTTFDPTKLRWLSAQHIARMELAELVAAVEDRVDRERFPLDGERLRAAVDAVRTRLSTFGEVNDHLALLFPERSEAWSEACREVGEDPDARRVVEALADELGQLGSWEEGELTGAVRRVGKRLGVRGPALFHPVRLVLCGERSGPALGKVLAAIGREETLDRIREALAGGTI